MTESIERGIPLGRAREITGDKQPTAWKIRRHFADMTDSERAIVRHNIEKEIKEIQEDKETQKKLRLNAPKDSKSLYTDRIKQLDKLLTGKKKQLKRLDNLQAKESTKF